MADGILKKVSQDEKIRELELAREKFWRDYHSGLSAAEEQGLTQGLELGKTQGLELDKIIGKESGIQALILDNLEEQKTEKQILNKLVKRFSLSVIDAKQFYEKYANSQKKS